MRENSRTVSSPMEATSYGCEKWPAAKFVAHAALNATSLPWRPLSYWLQPNIESFMGRGLQIALAERNCSGA
jgi:hypothetical protein